MATLELEGPESAKEAVESALGWEYSAVIIRDGVPQLDKYRQWSSASVTRRQSYPNIDLITDVSGFPFDVLKDVVTEWFANTLELRGIVFMHQQYRDQKIEAHCDFAKEQPFVVSVARFGTAEWKTQLASNEEAIELRDCRKTSWTSFEDEPDQFEQSAGDIVIVPGYDDKLLNPSKHSVKPIRCTLRKSIVYRFINSSDPRQHIPKDVVDATQPG